MNLALQNTGVVTEALAYLAASGVDPGQLAPLFAATVVLASTVSNVPAVMLLLPVVSQPFAGDVLALVSTFSGNLLIVGSIANMTVVGAAAYTSTGGSTPVLACR